MKGRILYSCLLTWICIAGLTNQSLAQTITSVTFPAATVCPGSDVTVSYTISGTFNAGNTFTAFLSNSAGTSFPTSVGSVSSRVAGTITARIPAGTTNGSGYLIRVVASNPNVNATSASQLTISAPSAPGVTPPPAYCQGDAASALVATATSGATLRWYGTDQTGGTSSPVAPIPGTTTVGSTTYYVSQVVGGCEGPRSGIVVTVKGKPGAPGVSGINYCVGQTAGSLTASPAAGGTLNWYGTSASSGSASSVAPVPSTGSAGTTTYYVSQTVDGCEGPRAGLVVTVNGIPSAPTTTAPSPYCEGATALALSATPSAGGTLRWYGTAATGGTSVTNATTPNTSIVGTTNYYVSQAVNNCESPRAAIPVIVRASPSAPATTSAPDYCQNQTASALVATPAAGATLNWYGTAASGGAASAIASVPATNQAGTFTYYVSQTANGCEGPRASISVTIKGTPGAPTVSSPLIACQNRPGYSLTATPSGGGTLNWYGTSATGGTSTATAPTLSTVSLGSTNYYVSQSVNGCEGARALITVTVNAVPAAPVATAPSPYCEGTTAVALTATGQNLKWYGTAATGGTGSSSPTIPTTALLGPTNYFVSQTVSGCESERTSILVVVKDTPAAPGVSAVEFCQEAALPVLAATPVPTATINWYGTSSTGGTASTTAPVPSKTAVGTTVYYVSQTLDGCEGPRASLNVRVKATPSAPGVAAVSYCNNSQAQPLTATAAGPTLKWFDAADKLLTGAPTPNTGSVGDQTFKVSQISSENCESPRATITVTIKPLPAPPGVKPLTYCQKQIDQIQQNVTPLEAAGSNLKWSLSDGNPFSSPPTPSIDKAGTQIFLVTQTVNGCTSSAARLEVSVLTPAIPTVIKPVVTYCINDRAVPLEASTNETGAQLRWVDPAGNVTVNAPTPPTLNKNVQEGGDAFYVYQIANYGCASARATVRVVVNTPPTLALAAPVASVNLGQRAPLQLKFTGAGPYSYSLTEGYSGQARTDTTISVLPRGNTTYQIVSVSNACGVGLPGTTATITVRVPTVSTSSFATTTLCAGTSLSVPFTTTGEFNTGNAFRIEVASVADTSKKFTFQSTAAGSPVTGTVPLSLASGQYYVRVKADNPEIGITGSNSPTLLTVRSLPTATLTGTQNIYEGSPVNLTITFGGDGPWDAIYADSLRTYPITATTSPLIVEARPARTTAYRLTSVTNSCGSGPVSGTATISVLPLLGVDDNSLDPLVKAYPVPTVTKLIVELNLPLTRDPAILSLTDQRGKPVLQHTTRGQMNELDLSGQPSGLYILRIRVGDRETARKVLKQ
ncbi:T9SS type A sorting domain-containing protein [Spirosoma sp.]|uniref:T9SS type A sorting domain-containing protein n=1 Tax=Spirosoma sp. TaxID=1899569 RepID=UPI002626CF28|nr:T9SS type A sorting domain-containing protein [Spirosoma sp.]MCX6213098.1 T9SS type A sorting domain-containing protein [Spirosoma sp.]